jgi:hypothetical protein
MMRVPAEPYANPGAAQPRRPRPAGVMTPVPTTEALVGWGASSVVVDRAVELVCWSSARAEAASAKAGCAGCLGRAQVPVIVLASGAERSESSSG